MNDKNPSNFSDEESQNLERKKKKKKKKSKGTFKREAVPKVDLSSISDPDIDNMLKKMRTMDKDLQLRMDKVAELSGMSPREVMHFIENPDNFPAKQWSLMQQKKRELEEKIYAGIGVEYHKRILKKKKNKVQKGRSGKTLGYRKGWIQM
jgi:hypothetical protein